MKIIKYIVVLVLILSCKHSTIEKPKKPDNLISKGKMVDILYDITIVNTAVSTQKIALKNNGLQPKAYIFNKYNIDSLQFALSNNYYAFNPDIYKDIYDRLNKRLSKEKAHYQAILDSTKTAQALQKKIKDSIQKLKQSKEKGLKLKPDLLKKT